MIRFSLAILLLLTLSGCVVDGKPAPGNLAGECLADYGQRLGNDHRAIAAGLRSGEIKTEPEMQAAIRELTEASQHQAFLPLNQKLMDEIGGENFTPENAAQFHEELAQQFGGRK